MPKQSHTLILIQYTQAFESRGYLDFKGVKEAMDALVKVRFCAHYRMDAVPLRSLQYDT